MNLATLFISQDYDENEAVASDKENNRGVSAVSKPESKRDEAEGKEYVEIHVKLF